MRHNSRWDIPFDGFERVPASIAKRSGHFNLLGEQRPIDDSVLVGLIDSTAGGPGGLQFKPNGRPGNMMSRMGGGNNSIGNGATGGASGMSRMGSMGGSTGRSGEPLRITASGEQDTSAAAFVAPLAPESSRSSRRIIVSSYKPQGYDVTADEVAAYFTETLATINLLTPVQDAPVVKLARASNDGSFIMLEFATTELATIANTFNGSFFKGLDSEWVMAISRAQDYITPSPSRLEFEEAADAGIKLRAEEIEAERKRLTEEENASQEDLEALDKFKSISARVLDSKNKLYVADLPFFLKPTQILDLLAAFGEVVALQIVTDKNSPAGETRGIVFLEYKDAETVNKAALLGLSGMEIGDSRLRVGRATYGLHAPWASLPMGVEAMVNLARNIEQESDTKNRKTRRSTRSSSSTGSSNSRHKRSSRDYETTDESEGEDDKSGIKHEDNNDEENEDDDAPLETGHRRAPSRILMLLNAVTPENLSDDQEYAEIVEDVQAECSKYGTVEEVLVPRSADGAPPNNSSTSSFSEMGATGVGKIYVKFAQVAACRAACRALGGRKFSDRTVVSTYFPEDNFELRVF